MDKKFVQFYSHLALFVIDKMNLISMDGNAKKFISTETEKQIDQ